MELDQDLIVDRDPPDMFSELDPAVLGSARGIEHGFSALPPSLSSTVMDPAPRTIDQGR